MNTQQRGVREMSKTLTNTEYNLLNRIAEQSKMDCWFCIKQTSKGEDYVYDLENRKRMSLRKGITQLIEGIDGMYDEYLNEQDYKVLISLLLQVMPVCTKETKTEMSYMELLWKLYKDIESDEAMPKSEQKIFLSKVAFLINNLFPYSA